jgi:hypothetical protein
MCTRDLPFKKRKLLRNYWKKPPARRACILLLGKEVYFSGAGFKEMSS